MNGIAMSLDGVSGLRPRHLNLPVEMDDNMTKELAAHYPHILEKITSLWSKPAQLRPYFQELLVTKRETRQGFPMGVYMEIFALSERYGQIKPAPGDCNDDFWMWVNPRA